MVDNFPTFRYLLVRFFYCIYLQRSASYVQLSDQLVREGICGELSCRTTLYQYTLGFQQWLTYNLFCMMHPVASFTLCQTGLLVHSRVVAVFFANDISLLHAALRMHST